MLFLSALEEAFLKSWKWFFSSFGSSVAVFVFLKTQFNWTLFDSIVIGLLFFLTITIFRSLIIYYNKYRKQKNVNPGKNVYGEAIKILADGFARVHQHRKKTQTNIDNIIDTLVFLCDSVQELFEIKTCSKCSVSIKVLTSNVLIDQIDPQAEVVTLCRDSDNNTSRNNGKKGSHNIFNNSCYNHILDNIGKPKGKFYLNNNLPADLSYKNTSSQVYGELPDNCKDEKERTANWKLPYMSEIVVPITPMIENSVTHNELIGFLCVDSSHKNSFNTNYDVHLVRGVADGVYDLLESIYYKNYAKN